MVKAEYQNGNYHVTIYDDGTKVKESLEKEFKPEFPDTIDMTITKKCYRNCPFCYLNCTSDGKDFDLSKYKDLLKSIKPYTEIAVNGNMIDAEWMKDFLEFMKSEVGAFVNVTFDYDTFVDNIDLIHEYQRNELITGIGVSLNKPADLSYIINTPNAVIHSVIGVMPVEFIDYLLNHKDKGKIKLLLIGYKDIGRGVQYYIDLEKSIDLNTEYLSVLLPELFNNLAGVYFDNLAIDQLDLFNSGIVTQEQIDLYYMGPEGEQSFYIDLVDNKYAISSCESESNNYQIDALDVSKLFQNIRRFKI